MGYRVAGTGASQGSLVTLALATLALGGCAASPEPRTLLAAPVPVRTIEGAPAVTDGRAGFREIFCSVLRADGLESGSGVDCDRWLWRLPDEPAEPPGRGDRVARPGKSPAVFLVTGAFSECIDAEARPFAAGAARLRTGGARFETIVVSGRSGSDSNAGQIAAALAQAQLGDDQPLILIGFSKGALDILHFLVKFPSAASQVGAVVGVSSPVFGSPLADKADAGYALLFDRWPHGACPPGDGEVIRSLRPGVAQHWLATNALPAHVRYYSLAGFATRERMARALVPSWKFLRAVDPRNDGQVVASDAVIPGSTLLGYANADHWGIASGIESIHPMLASRPDPTPFPTEQLLLSLVQFVARDSGVSEPGQAGNPAAFGSASSTRL